MKLIKFLIIFLSTLTIFNVIGCKQFNISDIDYVKISVINNTNDIKLQRVIFDGPSKDVEVFITELSKAKRIWIGFVIKEALIEGEYLVELYSANRLVGKYTVINSENIYDEINKKYLKRKMINYLPLR